MGVEPRGAPTDLPDFGEVGIGIGCGGDEGGAFLEGICGEVGGEGFEGEGLVGGGDVEVEIAPGAPPEGLKGAVRAAVGEKAVGEAEGDAAFLHTVFAGVIKRIAVALMKFVVVKRLRVSEYDVRAFAAGDDEARIRGG